MKAQLNNTLACALAALATSVLAEPVQVEAPAAVAPRAATMTPMQCYTEGPFLDCIKPLTAATTCADQSDPTAIVSCACSQGSALYSCYTNNCASDEFFSSYKAGLDACSSVGAGNGGAPPPAAATTTGSAAAATGGSGGGGSKTSSSSAGSGTGAARNAAAGPSVPGSGLAGMGASLALVLGVVAWL